MGHLRLPRADGDILARRTRRVDHPGMKLRLALIAGVLLAIGTTPRPTRPTRLRPPAPVG